MKKKETGKKKKDFGQIVAMLFFVAIGAAAGLVMAKFMLEGMAEGETLLDRLPVIAVLFMGLYVIMFAHIALHEAGHLLFGLLTGYGFSSYRVGSLMLVKESGKLRLRALSIAGTGGQCLMTPPDMADGKIPYVLLGEKDAKKAEKIQIQFEKMAKKYPYPGDVQSERELMELAAQRAKEMAQ